MAIQTVNMILLLHMNKGLESGISITGKAESALCFDIGIPNFN